MQVVHIDSGREMRGGQWQVMLLMRGLRGAGHEQILLARPESPLFGRATAEGFDVRPYGAMTLARLLSAAIVHAHDAHAHTLAACAAKVPFVVSRRVAFPIGTGWLSRWKYRRATRYIAVSEYVRRRLVDAGVAPRVISVVYDATPAAEPAAGDWIVAPWSDDPQKGADLVRAAATLAGVEVRFSRDLPADISRARMFLYITRQEGLGSAALLAMAAGLPVIASRVGGLPEAVEEGVTGLTVPNQPERIAEAMRRLLDHPGLAVEMGMRGRERAAARFSIEAMVRGTLAVYEEVVLCSKR